VNQSWRDRINETERKQMDNVLTYKRQFRKTGRLLLTTLRYGLVEDDQDIIIKTNTEFYKDGQIDSTDVADQNKIIKGSSTTIGGKITYSEPISLKWNMVMEYSFNRNDATSRHNTYDKDGSQKYTRLDTLYSNNFDMDAKANAANLIFRYMGSKLKSSLGSGISSVRLHLNNLDKNNQIQYNFLNLTPQATISYMYKPQARVSFVYRGNTQQPTIDQMQPIRNNTDRLNIFVGNPLLKVGFNHNFSVSASNFKTLSRTYMYGSFNYRIPVNSISMFNSVDLSKGSQISTPVNINGNRNWNLWGNISKDGGEKKWGYGMNINASGGKNYNLVNQLDSNSQKATRNRTDFFNSDLGLNFSYNNPDKFNIDIRPSFGYNKSVSSVNSSFNSNYWNYGGNINIFKSLPLKLELSTDVNFNLRQRLDGFSPTPNQINWNANLSRRFMKEKAARISIEANDLLNQNIGFDRNITSNFISEERYSRLSRYFLLKFEWSFNKMGGQK
jgi:hypothetical protein